MAKWQHKHRREAPAKKSQYIKLVKVYL